MPSAPASLDLLSPTLFACMCTKLGMPRIDRPGSGDAGFKGEQVPGDPRHGLGPVLIDHLSDARCGSGYLYAPWSRNSLPPEVASPNARSSALATVITTGRPARERCLKNACVSNGSECE